MRFGESSPASLGGSKGDEGAKPSFALREGYEKDTIKVERDKRRSAGAQSQVKGGRFRRIVQSPGYTALSDERMAADSKLRSVGG